MDDSKETELFKGLRKTELLKELQTLRAIYTKLEAHQKRFTARFSIHCKAGCGECCAHLRPDLTEIEATYLAFGLIAEGRDEEVLEHLTKDPQTSVCPLYRADSDYHCTVYKWRPLICRLFGASASHDKAGRATFRHCKWNTGTPDLTPEELELHRRNLVLMRDYGLMLESAEAGRTDTRPVEEALPQAIFKVHLMLQLEAESKQDHS